MPVGLLRKEQLAINERLCQGFREPPNDRFYVYRAYTRSIAYSRQYMYICKKIS